MFEKLIIKRNLPEIRIEENETWDECRKRILNVILNEEYGFLPVEHTRTEWEVEKEEVFCAGKAKLYKVRLDIFLKEEKFSFPVYASIPAKSGKHPFFVHINFRDNVPDRYQPTEEIIDRGFAILSFCYNDVWTDCAKLGSGEDFYNKAGKIFFDSTKREENHAGQIAVWAWAASRVMDYAQSLDCLDFERSAVVGHSRLGKTALLAMAMDERFSLGISNNSGCGGAAISREKDGERIEVITKNFPIWFCENFKKYAKNEDKLPFDQHFLLAAAAPRKVYVASAKEDIWADPVSEYMACVEAGKVYERLGKDGFVHPDRLPKEGDVFCDGNVAYHLRSGTHYLSREDWNMFMDYMEK